MARAGIYYSGRHRGSGESSAAELLGIYKPKDFGAVWRAKAASVVLTRVAFVGDSLFQGGYASSIETKSMKGLVRIALQAQYGNGGSGFKSTSDTNVTNTINSTWGPQLAASDLYALSGTWTCSLGNTDGPGATVVRAESNSATMTRTINGTSIETYITTGNSSTYGTYDVLIDGNVVINARATNTGAFGIDKQTFSVAAGDHTVVIRSQASGVTSSANRTQVFGTAGYNASGVAVDGYGRPSFPSTVYNNKTLTTWTTNTPVTFGGASNGAFGLAGEWSGGRLRNADLVIYGMGLNDCHLNTGTITPDSFIDNVRNYLQGVREGTGANANTEILLLMQHRGALAWEHSTQYYTTYVQRMRTLAESYGCAFLNLWALGKNSHQWMIDQGYMGNVNSAGAAGSDQVHMSDTGHQWVANQILSVI